MADNVVVTFILTITICRYLTVLTINEVASKEEHHFSGFETEVRSVGDGKKVVTTYTKRQLGPEGFLPVNQGPFFHPNSWNNMVFNPRLSQRATNTIDRPRTLPGWSGWNFGFESFKLKRSVRNTARTVESPALSVDTGGRPSGGTVAGEIAKILNVKQGHYSDIYDQFDRTTMKPKRPVSTRRPADLIEEAARRAVVMMFDERRNNNQKSS